MLFLNHKKEELKMELTKKQIKEDVEMAIRIRDKCSTLAEKDALERLINFSESVIKWLDQK